VACRDQNEGTWEQGKGTGTGKRSAKSVALWHSRAVRALESEARLIIELAVLKCALKIACLTLFDTQHITPWRFHYQKPCVSQSQDCANNAQHCPPEGRSHPSPSRTPSVRFAQDHPHPLSHLRHSCGRIFLRKQYSVMARPTPSPASAPTRPSKKPKPATSQA